MDELNWTVSVVPRRQRKKKMKLWNFQRRTKRKKVAWNEKRIAKFTPKATAIVCGYLWSRWQNIKLWIYRTKRSKKKPSKFQFRPKSLAWSRRDKKNRNSTCYFFLFDCCLSFSLFLSLSSSTFFHCCCCYWEKFGSYEVILMRLNWNAEQRKRNFCFLPKRPREKKEI